jgi:ATP-dependent 26S proteasome regulatory subunit
MSIPDNTLVIFEDVDTLLAPREGQDGNELMSMLLNELQGIASKKIKLVITTNLSTRNKIDQALIRPGRCYKAVETRELTLHEATRVVNHYELPESCAAAGTLAEIFEGRMKKVRVGFSPE